MKECPASGEEVTYFDCARCEQFRIWKEGDVQMCRYEFEELRDSGFYSESEEEWLDHLQEADPETYQRLIEEKRNRERVLEKMDNEKTVIENDKETGTEIENEQKNKKDDEKEDETDENDEDDVEKDPEEDDEDEEFLF